MAEWLDRLSLHGAEGPGFKTQLLHGINSLCSPSNKGYLTLFRVGEGERR